MASYIKCVRKTPAAPRFAPSTTRRARAHRGVVHGASSRGRARDCRARFGKKVLEPLHKAPQISGAGVGEEDLREGQLEKKVEGPR